MAGWRRDRGPEAPSGMPVGARPDWVGEILSPSNARRDTVDKLRVLHRAEVPHCWLLDPIDETLVVHRHARDGYLVALTAVMGETVRAEPFDAVELRVGVLLGDEDADE